MFISTKLITNTRYGCMSLQYDTKIKLFIMSVEYSLYATKLRERQYFSCNFNSKGAIFAQRCQTSLEEYTK